jgi:hypothetical protein
VAPPVRLTLVRLGKELLEHRPQIERLRFALAKLDPTIALQRAPEPQPPTRGGKPQRR